MTGKLKIKGDMGAGAEAPETLLARRSLLELHEDGAARDAVSLGDVDAPDARLVRGDERRLHLHRLEEDEWLPRLHALSLGTSTRRTPPGIGALTTDCSRRASAGRAVAST